MKNFPIQEQIATILMRDWDPAGIFDIAEARDEYDAYTNELSRMILNGADREFIRNYISNVQVKNFGIHSSVNENLLDELASLGAVKLSTGHGPTR